MNEGRQSINGRREVILKIISEEPVSTQTELMFLLKNRGFKVTQATVSRDIRELKLYKITDADGRAVYTSPDRPDREEAADYKPARSVFGGSVLKVVCSGNMIVIRTESGMAQAVCAVIDKAGIRGILGTIAGDDTIFAVVSEGFSAGETAAEISDFLK